MTDRPILFSAPMVRALLEGRKTQTRRIIKPQPPAQVTSAGVISRSDEGQTDEWSWLSGDPRDIDTWGFEGDFKVRFVPGDRLWVKETYRLNSYWDEFKSREADQSTAVHYQADIVGDLPFEAGKSRPSIFMPRWASRLTLMVEEVRVERLQDISDEDALAEGVTKLDYPPFVGGGGETYNIPGFSGFDDPVSCYIALWQSLNGANSWRANPFVVALTFSVHRCNIEEVPF